MAAIRLHGKRFDEKIRQYLTCDPETGIVRWKRCPHNCVVAGSVAGNQSGKGYVQIIFLGRRLYAHRVLWFLCHGRWPKELDHVNGIRSDNRLANLREATKSQNAANSPAPRTNTSGFKGVSFHSVAGKWTAKISVNDRTVYLGLFDTPEAAYEVYAAEARRLRGEFARID